MYYSQPLTIQSDFLKKEQYNFLNYNPTLSPPDSTCSLSSIDSFQEQPIQKKKSNLPNNVTWLVFKNQKWIPFERENQRKLERTLTVGGTFVDIQDHLFPEVNRVRVFPKNNYLSYLGVKYRLSRIMQPDAYLDHVSIAEANKDKIHLASP